MDTKAGANDQANERRRENSGVAGGCVRFGLSFVALIALALLFIGVVTTGVAAVWSASASVSYR